MIRLSAPEWVGLLSALAVLAISLYVYFDAPSDGHLVLPSLIAIGLALYFFFRGNRSKNADKRGK